MAGRKYISGLYRSTERRRALLALITLSLLGSSLWALRRAAAERPPAPNVASANSATVSSAPNHSVASLAGREFAVSEEGAVIGEYEGYFDGATRTLRVQAKGDAAGAGKNRRRDARHDPSGELVRGQDFAFNVLHSAYVTNNGNPPTVSGEIELTNNTGATFYNTRIVFTSFKLGGPGGADAGNMPGANGFAYFNDGQVAYNGSLAVSRFYGDIPAGGKVAQVWNFAVGSQPPTFFFAYKVLADVGVAAESVAPAAVQVNASTGTSVTINGRGFTGTPGVQLLGGSSPIALTDVTATGTTVTATVPAGTAPGRYSVRVVNPGGTAGGAGSSTLVSRLTVTGAPEGDSILTGGISSLPGSGPFLVSGAVTINSNVTIPAGAVVYIANGATITVAAGGSISADGGTPGIPATNPAQIVFTAQRAAGAALPSVGAWNGIDATAASTALLTMRNVVVEYGGTTGGAAINLTGSGRTLRFTDGIVRGSGGAAIMAGSAGDSLIGFTRNRIENNGTASSIPALLLSGNAALGLWDIASANAVTSVGDPNFFYTSANEFIGNQGNFIQIGTNANTDSNDFTESGVLVGQAPTPFQIQGNCSNPAIVGAAPPAAPVELAIGPTAIVHLAPELNLLIGDFATDRVGCIAADGYGGFYQGPQAAVANKFIEFNKIPSAGNFGALFFARNAMVNCILNYVRVQNGGAASACFLGAGELITESNLRVTNSQITSSASGGILQLLGAAVNTRGTTTSGNAQNIIETIAGGLLGEGVLASRATLVNPILVATDPLGRGIYIAESAGSANLIRFVNTTRASVVIGGQSIAAGAISTVVGGGLDIGDNIPGRSADPGNITGLAVSSDGNLVYWIDGIGQIIRAFNAGNTPQSVNGGNLPVGNVRTVVSSGLGTILNGLAVSPTTGEIFVADASNGINKIFKAPVGGGTPIAVAGNGSTTTRPGDAFAPGASLSIPLLQPRAITFDPQGNLYIADTGHARVIRVDGGAPGGNTTLYAQFPSAATSGGFPYNNNPLPSGLVFFNGRLYIANGNSQDIARVDRIGLTTSTDPGIPDGNQKVQLGPTTSIAGANASGAVNRPCVFTQSVNCGDGGPANEATFTLTGSNGTPPLAGIAADSRGLYILDQGSLQRGRVRFINLSQAAVEIAGVSVNPNQINTVVGTGLSDPFDTGLATAGSFSQPTGVAMDAQGNLWITDTLRSRLRFVNLTSSNDIATQADVPLTVGVPPVEAYTLITPGMRGLRLFPGTEAQQFVPLGAVVTINKDVGGEVSDDVPANKAGFDTPQGIVVTAQGVYIADSRRGPSNMGGNARRTGLIRFINTTNQPVDIYPQGAKITVAPGFITTIAGTPIPPISDVNANDGASPLNARFIGPTDLAVNPTNGDIYIAEPGRKSPVDGLGGSTVRRVNGATGAVSTILTGGNNDAYIGLSLDSQNRLLIANGGTRQPSPGTNPGNSQILREKAAGQCATAPGASCVDNISVTGVALRNPRDVVEGRDGALYVTNVGPSQQIGSVTPDNRILRIVVTGTSGVATAFAGTGEEGYTGDGGPATQARLALGASDFVVSVIAPVVSVRSVVSIIVGLNGELIFTDSRNGAIRRIR